MDDVEALEEHLRILFSNLAQLKLMSEPELLLPGRVERSQETLKLARVADHLCAYAALVAPVLLLLCSNLFMTVAWYGHLRFKAVPLWGVILASWAIAFIEYCFAVPANRYGNAVYSAAQLKTMQEVITLLVFSGFSLVYLKEPIGWNHLVGFALISAGAFFLFQKW